jgi:hypothetical protein
MERQEARGREAVGLVEELLIATRRAAESAKVIIFSVCQVPFYYNRTLILNCLVVNLWPD